MIMRYYRPGRLPELSYGCAGAPHPAPPLDCVSECGYGDDTHGSRSASACWNPIDPDTDVSYCAHLVSHYPEPYLDDVSRVWPAAPGVDVADDDDAGADEDDDDGEEDGEEESSEAR